MIKLNINGKQVDLDAEADTPLLWALRDDAGLTGTKFGCGMGICGACSNFSKQLEFLRRAVQAYPGPDEGTGTAGGVERS